MSTHSDFKSFTDKLFTTQGKKNKILASEKEAKWN